MKKLLAATFLSLLAAGPAAAWPWDCCCKKCMLTVHCRQYNAFSPFCCDMGCVSGCPGGPQGCFPYNPGYPAGPYHGPHGYAGPIDYQGPIDGHHGGVLVTPGAEKAPATAPTMPNAPMPAPKTTPPAAGAPMGMMPYYAPVQRAGYLPSYNPAQAGYPMPYGMGYAPAPQWGYGPQQGNSPYYWGSR